MFGAVVLDNRVVGGAAVNDQYQSTSIYCASDGRAAVNKLAREGTTNGRIRGHAAVLNRLLAALIDHHADGGAALIKFYAANVDDRADGGASLDKFLAAKGDRRADGDAAKDIFSPAVVDQRAVGCAIDLDV